ncbi:MAG: hypothetical protein ACYC3L_05075 [Gemmatimonadaceae bacterium]
MRSPANTPESPPRAPHAVPNATAPRATRRGADRSRYTLILLTLPLLAINALAVPYYAMGPGERARHPWHKLLRPSGTIGQSAGILAFLIFVFLWLYPLRKKFKRLAFTGSVGKWLDVHVTSALVLPLLLGIHAAWHSDGVIGLGLVAMLVVIASGIVGRYLYVRIPRAKSGVELSRDEVASARRDLLERLAASTGQSPPAIEEALALPTAAGASRGIPAALWLMITNDLPRARRRADLRRRWQVAASGGALAGRALDEAVMLADREMALDQQARMLEATHRVFRFWHVAHRPFAVTALIAVTIHIVVVVAVGATWFR